MSGLDIALVIIIPSAIVLGLGLFFLSGVYVVKKNKAILIEKTGQFYGVYKKGVYFFMPILYQRKGVYSVGENKQDIHILNGRVLVLTYEIEDVEKFHYSELNIEQAINEVNSTTKEMSEELLENALKEIGVKYISIRAK